MAAVSSPRPSVPRARARMGWVRTPAAGTRKLDTVTNRTARRSDGATLIVAIDGRGRCREAAPIIPVPLYSFWLQQLRNDGGSPSSSRRCVLTRAR